MDTSAGNPSSSSNPPLPSSGSNSTLPSYSELIEKVGIEDPLTKKCKYQLDTPRKYTKPVTSQD